MTSTLIEKIDKSRLPRHIAFIMDGNGRWAKKRFLPRIAGHHEGAKRLRPLIIAGSDLGIKALTFYSFSVENWNRPKEEVSTLMKILHKFLTTRANTDLFHENNVRFNIIGSTEKIPDFAKDEVLKWQEETKNNTGLIFTLALSYSSQDEITRGVQKIAEQVKNNELNPEEITTETIENSLMTKDLPPLDLVVRTSGEYRISNFLLWQAAYAEFYFTDLHWPDFKEKQFYQSIIDYQGRNRRFGLTDEQLKEKNKKS